MYLVLFLGFVITLVIYLTCFRKKGKKYPNNIFMHFHLDPPESVRKEMKKVKKLSKEETDKIMDRTIYTHPEFLKEKYDVIVVGSGLSGLVTSGLLSRIGKKVLILEAHDRFGGCCHVYEEKGFEFCSGVHYVNNSQKPVFRWPLDICCERQVEYRSLKDEEKEAFVFGETDKIEFEGHYNIDKLQTQLEVQFPHEKKGLIEFFGIAKKCVRSYERFVASRSVPFPINLLLNILGYDKLFHKYGKFTANEMMDKCGIKDVVLRGIINCPHGMLSTHGEDTYIFPLCALMLDILMLKDAIVGGGVEIPRRIIPNLKSGSKALHNARVKNILFDENEQVSGVKLVTGEEISSPMVISSCGIQNTYEFLPKKIRPKTILGDVLKKVEYTGYFFLVHLGLDCLPHECGIEHNMVRFFGTKDRSECYRNLRKMKPPEFEEYDKYYFLVMMHDYNNNENTKLCLLTFCFPEWFEKFRGTKTGERGMEYEEWKDKYTEKVLSVFYKHYPDAKEHTAHVDSATDLTMRDFVFSPTGSSYGLNSTYEKLDLVMGNRRVFNPLKNLYLVGQDITSDGLFPVCMSTFYALGDIMNRNLFMDLKKAEAYHQKMEKKKE